MVSLFKKQNELFLIQNGYLNGLKENPPSLSPPLYLEESIHLDTHFGGGIVNKLFGLKIWLSLWNKSVISLQIQKSIT